MDFGYLIYGDRAIIVLEYFGGGASHSSGWSSSLRTFLFSDRLANNGCATRRAMVRVVGGHNDADMNDMTSAVLWLEGTEGVDVDVAR